MQYAWGHDDHKTWEAREFSQLSVADLEQKRRNLVCVECKQFAWYRKESVHGHPPHFCAHHAEHCSLRVVYELVDDKLEDSTNLSDQISSTDKIVVHLDKEKGGVVDVTPVLASPDEGNGSGGTRFVKGAFKGESSQHFTLRRILHHLVSSQKFGDSDTEISFLKNDEEILIAGTIKDVVIEFSRIRHEIHHEKLGLFWGPIASAAFSKDGKLWLNSSDSQQGVSVLIFEDIAQAFLDLFKIRDPSDELLGAHVLTYGRCYFSPSTGKPVIRCSTPKYIFVRRYKDERIGD